MVAHNDIFNGVAVKNVSGVEQITNALAATVSSDLTNDDVVFLCIGTDRMSGDALGPFVGTYLTGLGYKNVIGTLDEPCHAQNLRYLAKQIPSDKKVIAIDASLGEFDHVGTTTVIKGSIAPGQGVKKDLGEYGDYGITGVVNVTGFMEYFVLANTRLSVVTRMAKDITSAIVNAFPLEGRRQEPQRPISLQEVAVTEVTV